MSHFWVKSQQYSSRLCWCKCGPEAPCQQHWGMSLEAPIPAQIQDCCSSAWIMARGEKHKHWSCSRCRSSSGLVNSGLLEVVSPLPYIFLVKFKPLSYAAHRILIRPVQSQRAARDSTPVLLFLIYRIKAFRLSEHCTTKVTRAISLTVALRYIDFFSHNYEQLLKHLRHFSDTLKSLNGTPIFTTGLSK